MVAYSDEEADPQALADIFSLPEPTQDVGHGGAPPPRPPIILPRKMSIIRVTRASGGFTVSQQPDASQLPQTIEAKVAYEVRRGNSFRRYRPADFRFGSPPLEIEAESATVLSVNANTMTIGNLKPGFRVAVSGFDPARDLIVKVSSQEVSNDPQV